MVAANIFKFFIMGIIFIVFESAKVDTEGTFNLSITQFDTCKGPKQKDCAFATATISNSSTINYNLTVFQTVSPSKGEFDLKMTKLETCKGPKRKNCVEVVSRIVNGQSLDMNITVKEDMKTAKGKIIGSVNEKPLFRLEIKNMCDHIIIRPLVQSFFNNSDHCAIEKGRFHLNVDVQTLARNFYGGKFIYGNWKFKWIFYNEFCNMQCNIMYLTMTPKRFAVGDK